MQENGTYSQRSPSERGDSGQKLQEPEGSYSQADLFSCVRKTVNLPAEFESALREIMQICGYRSESDVFVGVFFYALAFWSEHHLSAQVMNDEPELRRKAFAEAVERFHRLKRMSPEQRRAAEGFGPALSAHIAKLKNLNP